MDKKKILTLILAVGLVALLAGAYIPYSMLSANADTKQALSTKASLPAAEETEERDLVLAPDFTVYDANGNPVSLWDLRGKPVVLNFWASWCGPCKMEMPHFETAYQTYGDRIHFMVVDLTDGGRETVETAQAYLEFQGYTFPAYFDTTQEAAMTYGVSAIPSTYFIDADGFAIAQAQGALDAETLQRGLELILPTK